MAVEDYFKQNGLEGLYEELVSKTKKNVNEIKENCERTHGSGGQGSGGQTLDPDNPLPPENIISNDDINSLFGRT